jgi:hypothetical protein
MGAEGVVYRICCVAGAALIAGVLAGCAQIDSTLDDRYDSVDRAAGKARNESVLRNIARASEDIPLTFMAFSKVSGTLQANVSAALPNFVIGPSPFPTQVQRDVVIGNTTLGGSTTAANAVDFAILESSDFYRALLDPSDLLDFNFLVRQGYSRELLFWLFADSVRITVRNNKRPEFYEIRNRVTEDESCQYLPGLRRKICFRDIVDVAIGAGLSVQSVTREEASSSSGGGQGRGGAKGSSSSKPARSTISRLCFDPFFAKQAAKDSPAAHGMFQLFLKAYPIAIDPLCSSDWIPTQSARLGADKLRIGSRGKIEFEILTRSTFGIYQFLGRILAADATDKILMTGRSGASEGERRILSIVHDQTSDCAVNITLRGKYYCVPEQGSDNTKRIFSLLSQLIALKTQTQDLGITPTVRLSP